MQQADSAVLANAAQQLESSSLAATIMLRSVADIARGYGEDLEELNSKWLV